MSFRCRQKLKLGSCQVVMEPEQVTLESGEIVTQIKDLGKEKLPDSELFELKNQLKAGVELEEVNSKVLRSSKVSADSIVRKYLRKETKNIDNSKGE